MDRDLILYERFLSGDAKALETLVVRYSDNLIRFAYLYVKDSAAAEDIAEDVFVALLLKKKPFTQTAKLTTYLYKIARNKSIDYLRRRKKTLPMEDVDVILHSECFERDLENKERNQTLYRCIASLPEQYREILLLHYFEDFSIPQICKILQKSAKQVYNLLSRAKLSLKKSLQEEGVHEP